MLTRFKEFGILKLNDSWCLLNEFVIKDMILTNRRKGCPRNMSQIRVSFQLQTWGAFFVERVLRDILEWRSMNQCTLHIIAVRLIRTRRALSHFKIGRVICSLETFCDGRLWGWLFLEHINRALMIIIDCFWFHWQQSAYKTRSDLNSLWKAQ